MSASKKRFSILSGIIAATALWMGAPRIWQTLAPAPAIKSASPARPEVKTPPTTLIADSFDAAKARHIRHKPVDPATLPPGTVWTFREDDTEQTYAIALDELYLPTGDAPGRLHTIPPRSDLASLLAEARHLAGSAGVQPRLVLYPLDAPRDEQNRRIVTMQVHIETNDLASVQAAANSLGLEAWKIRSYAPGHAFAEVQGDPAQPLRAAAFLASLPHVTSAIPLLAVQRSKRAITLPADPLFPKQWHLRNTGQQSGVSGMDINVASVWTTLRGKGIAIGIVDDGLQITHPDLAPNVAATGNYDWDQVDTDPSPNLKYDFHGTAVAGLAAAAGNGQGVVGAAPEATLYGLRLIALPETDQDDGDSMDWMRDVIQIKSCSWGPADDTPWFLGKAGPLWKSAVAAGTSGTNTTPAGRNGLGTLYVWASGNGQMYDDQGGKDAFSSNINVIPVGAVTNAGVAADFSEGGAHLVVCAPGDAPKGIYTTDLVGAKGYNSGTTAGEPSDANYTSSFAGTSASAPIAAGALALILQSNPNLGWRDVKEILLRSSTQLEPASTKWVSRSGGLPSLPLIKHHPRYGGGLLNTAAAVKLASTWTNLGKETSITRSLAPNQVIPDKGDTVTPPVDLAFDFTADANLRVEHVEVTVSIVHPYRGDLQITLTSPGGTVSQLATSTPEDDGANYSKWVFTSVRHWGEMSRGAWKLSVRDMAKGDTGTFTSAMVKIHGGPPLPPSLRLDTPTVTARIGTIPPSPATALSTAYTYSYTGLPQGVGFDTLTGRLKGRATATGTFAATLTATDPEGLSTSRSFTIVIEQLPPSLVGVFNGFADRDTTLNRNLGGALTFTTTARGTLTGQINLGNDGPLLFNGNLDGAPGAHAVANITIPRTGLSALALHLDLPLDNTATTGTLGGTTSVSAWRTPWTTTTPAAAYLGYYTLALETPSGHGWPAGYTVGTVTVTAPGAVAWTLYPADGTTTKNGTTTLAADGTFMLFAPDATPVGSFLGTITLPAAVETPVRGDVSWLREKGSSAAQANQKTGFGPLALTLHGGRYTAPTAGALLLGLPATTDNALLSFGGADVNLGEQAGILSPRTITVASNNTIAGLVPGATNLKLSVNPATGRFSGTFDLTDPSLTSPGTTVVRSQKFTGVFLPLEGIGAGYFVLRALPGSSDLTTRSGTVLFNENVLDLGDGISTSPTR